MGYKSKCSGPWKPFTKTEGKKHGTSNKKYIGVYQSTVWKVQKYGAEPQIE